jgi:hypothetical protein
MRCASQTPQWSIPGIGVLRPCLDRVTIVSSATVGALKHFLPMAALAKVSHSFTINTYTGPDPCLQSRIIIVGTHTSDPWSLLAQHKRALGQHRVTQAEIAFDVSAESLNDARQTMLKLVGLLAKPRHQRRCVLSVHKPYQSPPPGCTAEPTFYFEDCESSVKLKCYVRYEKLPGGGFGGPCVRLEWTLTGKRALTRHLGGNQIKHLLAADLNTFLTRSIRLERANHFALGNLFRGIKDFKKPWKDPERAVCLILRWLAYREHESFGGDSQLALAICQNSPAQIRGYCRELRDRKHRRKRGRPKKHRPSLRTAITDARINRCFERLHLAPVAASYNKAGRLKFSPKQSNRIRQITTLQA